MNPVFTRKYFIVWAIALLLCASPLTVPLGMLLGALLLMVMGLVWGAANQLCDVWETVSSSRCLLDLSDYSNPNISGGAMDTAATFPVLASLYGLLVLGMFARALRTSLRGEKHRAMLQLKQGVTLLLCALAGYLSIKITMSAMSGM